MTTEVIVALIAAIVSLLGSLTTLIIALRSMKNAREKINNERERLAIETVKFQAEIAKLEAETNKLHSEVDDMRQQRLEIESANLEIEKQKALKLLETRNHAYPELLELVYRLRNQFQDNMVELKKEAEKPDLYFSGLHPPGQELYLLTENLYKYRAFIDEETFDLLHTYKRLLQDVKVLSDRMTRTQERRHLADSKNYAKSESQENKLRIRYYEDSIEQLESILVKVNELYPKITANIKKYTETILTRQ